MSQAKRKPLAPATLLSLILRVTSALSRTDLNVMRKFSCANLVRLLSVILILGALTTFPQQALVAQTTANVTISNQAQSSYTDEDGNNYNALSQVVSVMVMPVPVHQVIPDHTVPTETAPQNEQITRLFTIVNAGNIPDSYIVTDAAVTSPAELIDLYFDHDGSGTLTPADERITYGTQPGGGSKTAGKNTSPISAANHSFRSSSADHGLSVSPTLQPGATFGVLAVVHTRSIDDEQDLTINLTARSTTNPANEDDGTIINDVVRDIILTAPDDPNAPPLKLVEGQTRVTASVGQTLNYIITFRNRSEVAARQVLVTDELPAQLEYVAGTLRLSNQALTDADDRDQGHVSGQQLQVLIPQVAPGEVVTIAFRARVGIEARQSGGIVNMALMTGENFSPTTSSPAVVIVDPFGTVYAGRSGGSIAIPNAIVTLSTDSGGAPLTLTPNAGFPPNESNRNPYVTIDGGRFSFALSPEQIGTPDNPVTYTLNVTATGYRSRAIEVMIRPVANALDGLYTATLRALDGQPLAQAGSFALTNEPVTISNLAALAFNVPLFETSTLAIEKSADRPSAEIGDVVTYRVNLHNSAQSQISNLVVRDQLPESFVYAQGSAQIREAAGAWRAVEPEASGGALVFRLSSLGAGARLTISYRVRIGASAREGIHLNTATAEGIFSDGDGVSTPPAQAPVRVGAGAFSMRQVLIGRVFEDVNGDGMFDAGDRPIAKARIYTDKGQFILTDSAGMYNIPVLDGGALAIVLDRTTLPAGAALVDDGRRENRGFGRLLRTPLLGGGLLRQDFAVKAQSGGNRNPTQDTLVSLSKFTRTDELPGRANVTQATTQAATSKGQPSQLPSTPDNCQSALLASGETHRDAVKKPATPGTYEMESNEKIEAVPPGAIVIVTPRQNEVIMSPALEIEARVAHGWTVTLEVNGALVGAENIGTRKEFHASKVDSFTFVGINLRPGANRIVAKAVNPDGREGNASELSVMGRGPVKRLELITERKEMQADGRDTTQLIVRAFDEWGNPATDTQIAVSTSLGRLLPVDASTTQDVKVQSGGSNSGNIEVDAIQADAAARQQVLSLRNGVATVPLVSDSATGEARLSVTSGQIETQASIRIVPELRPALLIGLAEASFGRAAPEMSLHSDDSKFRGHLEFFFRGSVFGKNLLTLAYDSQRALNRTTGRDRLFELDPLDRAYPVFGDSSTRFEEASSNTKLYVRLDRGRSYFMFGDFETDLSDLSLSGYSRQLTGVKVHLENSQGDFVSVTGARPDTAFARDVFAGYELGLATLSHPDVLQGSETVVLEVRDRRNPEIILSRERLFRSIDYNLDPLSGQIFFLRPLTAFDFALNLRQVVITYEHYADGNASNVYTGRASKRFARYGLRVGLSFVNQQQDDFGSFMLGGFDGEKDTFRGGKLRFEYAMSRGRVAAEGNLLDSSGALDENVRRDGNAFRVELEQPLSFKQSVLRASFARSEAGFLNPFGATIAPGAQRATVSLEMRPRSTSQLRIGFSDERNRTENVDNERSTISAEWAEQLGENLRARLGFDRRSFNDERNDNDVDSNLITVGVEWRATDKLQLSATREQNLGEADPTYPNQTTLAANYQINNLTRLFFTQRLASDAIRPISDVQATGFAFTGSRYETAIGVETKLLRHTALSGRYQIENGINGTDSFAVIGLQHRLPLNQRSTLELGFERGFHLAGEGESFNTLLLGYSWHNESFRSSARYELRDRAGFSNIFTVGAAGKLGDDITVLGRLQYARGNTLEQENTSLQGTASLALRPLHTDRFALLFSYNTRSLSQANDARFEQTNDRVDTLSADGLWQASPKLEFYSRFALKFGENGRPGFPNVSTLTYLTQGRTQYRFGNYFDAALEGRLLAQPASATRRISVGTELGFWAFSDIRFGLGYNLTRAYEPDTATNIGTDRRGFYFNITTKLSRMFDLFGATSKGESDNTQSKGEQSQPVGTEPK